MTAEERADIDRGIENFNSVIRTDEGNFETKITYLNAGAIALTLTFLSFQEEIVGSLVLMVIGVSLCGASLAMNISQYLIAKIWHRTCINKLEKAKCMDTYLPPDDLIEMVCRKIDAMNWIVLILSISGISLLIIFVCLNV